jgi:hypothetical protein
MKTYKIVIIISLLIILGYASNRANKNKQEQKIISWIDNQGYWTKLAAKGIVPYNPEVTVRSPVYTGSNIKAKSVITLNSPDIAVADEGSTQSENSVFIDPLDETRVINSNNSATYPVDTAFGADALYSFNEGNTWQGSIEGAGGFNNGDPTTVIDLNGRWYVNYLGTDFGIYVSYSDDEGETWQVVDVANNPLINCDKSHMWIDNNPDSPYEGNIYVSWTNTSDLDLGQIAVSVSSDGGSTWNLNTNVSADIDAGSHNQGVNITTGPNGEAYLVWAVYDSWFSGGSDEVALGFTRSLDGGSTWEPSKRIISNIRGIRATKTIKNMRVNSFPVATVDNSTGADEGALYITWTNVGIPGINNGDEINIYLLKSFDQGNNFSEPVKVNNNQTGIGHESFFPWITCDKSTGILSMIYYDDRNVGGTDCEVFCANSIDGGQSWEEFKVSDVSFTPAPIPGLAADYMGDYLGISALNGTIYPVWTDNRLGYAMTFCSPYQTNPVERPFNLEGVVNEETGEVTLTWEYNFVPEFNSFVIYRNGDSISSYTDTNFVDILPDFGQYRYRVTAFYNNDIESGASGVVISWGAPKIMIITDSVYDHLAIGQTSEHVIQVVNTGELDLNYTINLDESAKDRDYCTAIGNSGLDKEYITSVEVGSINNENTGSDNYSYYSDQSTLMVTGHSYEITVTIANPFDLDKCGVWIDWDINGLFDENEFIELSGQTLSPIYTGIISPPPGTFTGQSRMRVRLQYSGELNPCGSTFFGEVEDYSVDLHGWLDVSPINDTISAGDTSNIIVTFNTQGLPEGDFNTYLRFTSNDVETGTLHIPVHIKTSYLKVSAISSDTLVCKGTKIDLLPSVLGSYDSLIFNWSSNPAGYSASVARPIAIVISPTWYIITVRDGDHVAKDSVFVDLFPVHQSNLPEDTVVCANSNAILDAGSGGIEYAWSTGDTSQYISVDTSGLGLGTYYYSVEVTNQYDCKVTDGIEVEFVDCTYIDEPENYNLSIYPNPANEFLIIKTFSPNTIHKIWIINIDGEIVYDDESMFYEKAEQIIDIQDIPTGYYTVRIQIQDKIITKNLVVLKN